jgi:predicted small integral membrane protein
VALAFGGGIFMFELAGIAMFAGLAVFAGAIVFAGLVMFALAFSFVAVLQPTAKAPKAKVANSAAILDLVMKPPLWSAVTEHSKEPVLDDFVKL